MAGSSSQMASSSSDDKPGFNEFVREISRQKLSNIIGSNSQGNYLDLLGTKTQCKFTFHLANDDWKCILKVWGPVEKLPEAEKLVDELLNQELEAENGVRSPVDGKAVFLPLFRSGSCSEIGPKPYMEDEHVCIDNLVEHLSASVCIASPGTFYGVFDGHGGLDAVCFSPDPPPRIEIPRSRLRRSISAEGLNFLKGVLDSDV